MFEWGVIGGSGFEKLEGFHILDELRVETPFGPHSTGMAAFEIEGHRVAFISRHGSRHEMLPSTVNYRANIYALKKLGVTKLIAFSAVGSLRKELAPGDLVIPSQYLDRTKGVRKVTFCEDGIVGHVSLAKPTWLEADRTLRALSAKFDFKVHFEKTAVCMEGPAFSTQAESNSYRAAGADIIGMTSYPEYALAREAGICYLPCSFVTDYDCWDDSIEHVTLHMVMETMRKNNSKAGVILRALLGANPRSDATRQNSALPASVFSTAHLTRDQKELLELLAR